MKFKKKFLVTMVIWIFFGVFINSLELVTIIKICQYPEHGPFFYGFPQIYRTNMTWVNTGSGIIYLLGLFINAVFWGSLSFGVYELLKKIFNIKFIKGTFIIISIFCFWNLCLSLVAFDLTFKMYHTDHMNYFQQHIDCQGNLEFFHFWRDTPAPVQ